MALIECKNCGNRISEKAVKCPHCGTEPAPDSLNEVQDSQSKGIERFEELKENISLSPDKPKKKKTPIVIICVLGLVIVLVLFWLFTYVIAYDDYSSSYHEDTLVIGEGPWNSMWSQLEKSYRRHLNGFMRKEVPPFLLLTVSG